MKDFRGYKYYKGEKQNPYINKDFGKAFWWKVESYAFTDSNWKDENELSVTMVSYLKEHHWDGECQHDIPWEGALTRAREMYLQGIWSQNYMTTIGYTLIKATKDSKRNNKN